MRLLLAVALLLMTAASFVTAAQYVVEVYFVVEPQVTRNYQAIGYNRGKAVSTIRTDVDYLVYQVNQMYSSMAKYGLDMEIRAKKIEFITDEMFARKMIHPRKIILAEPGLKEFQKWLTRNNARTRIGYDVAVVLTGYDLYETNNGTAGLAYVGAVCEPSGLAIVEFDGTMSTAVTIAHEIGHSLGSKHDDVASPPCPPGYIMDPTKDVGSTKKWFFSRCTKENIVKHMNEKRSKTKCLTDTSTPNSSFKMADMVNADILDPQKVCQRRKKDIRAYLCQVSKGDGACQTLSCAYNGFTACQATMPSDGMICDANKRCEDGRCVPSSIPTGKVDTNCVFGDVKYFNLDGITRNCQDLVGNDNSICYQPNLRGLCCATCKSVKRSTRDCEYGDRTINCKGMPAYQCRANMKTCCETCSGRVGKRSILQLFDLNQQDLSKDEDFPSQSVADDLEPFDLNLQDLSKDEDFPSQSVADDLEPFDLNQQDLSKAEDFPSQSVADDLEPFDLNLQDLSKDEDFPSQSVADDLEPFDLNLQDLSKDEDFPSQSVADDLEPFDDELIAMA